MTTPPNEGSVYDGWLADVGGFDYKLRVGEFSKIEHCIILVLWEIRTPYRNFLLLKNLLKILVRMVLQAPN